MLPDAQNDPAVGSKGLVGIAITSPVAFYLGMPVAGIRLSRYVVIRTTMPVATIDHYGDLLLPEDQVCRPTHLRYRPLIDAVTQSHGMHGSAYREFRTCVASSIPEHDSANPWSGGPGRRRRLPLAVHGHRVPNFALQPKQAPGLRYILGAYLPVATDANHGRETSAPRPQASSRPVADRTRGDAGRRRACKRELGGSVEYRAYLKEVGDAADATGGRAVSLAGGYFGVKLPGDDANILLALDLDSDEGWVAWCEDFDGERCCDAAEVVVGQCSLDELRDRAIAALSRHSHR